MNFSCLNSSKSNHSVPCKKALKKEPQESTACMTSVVIPMFNVPHAPSPTLAHQNACIKTILNSPLHIQATNPKIKKTS